MNEEAGETAHMFYMQLSQQLEKLVAEQLKQSVLTAEQKSYVCQLLNENMRYWE
jgi:hypothetical protein